MKIFHVTIGSLILYGLVQSSLGLEENIRCSIDIADSHISNDESFHHNGHRRMVSMDLDPSCDNSDIISINIPHINAKRSFQKSSSSQLETSEAINEGPIYNHFTPKQNNNMQTTTKFLSPAHVAWEGQDPEDGSTFTFVQDKNKNMAGSLIDITNQEVYQFRKQHDGSMSVTITKSKEFYPELDDDDIEPGSEDDHDHDGNRKLRSTASLSTISSSMSKSKVEGNLRHPYNEDVSSETFVVDDLTDNDINTHQGKRRRLSDNGSVLDIMIFWTEKAECSASALGSGCTTTSDSEANMLNLINLAVTETNMAYAASGVKTQLQLVHAYRHPSYVEGDTSKSLSDLQLGRIPDVHSNRRKYGADMVSMLVDNTDTCGMAYQGPRIDIMYTVVNWFCATANYSLGHEIGHTFGLRHDRGSTGRCQSRQYNYGYRDPNAKFRTVMAYQCESGQCDKNKGGECIRIKMFSNPKFKFDNLPVGSELDDAARVINENRLLVARYYTHVGPPTTSPTRSPTQSPTSAPTASPVAATASPTASPTGASTPAPTRSPVTSPVSNPTKSPTSSPTRSATSSPTASPTAASTSSCSDSTVRFRFDWKGTVISRDCIWVRTKATKQRCQPDGVSSTCAKACGTCSICSDSTLRFRFEWNGESVTRDCVWVRAKATKQRCKAEGVREACRKACGVCQ